MYCSASSKTNSKLLNKLAFKPSSIFSTLSPSPPPPPHIQHTYHTPNNTGTCQGAGAKRKWRQITSDRKLPLFTWDTVNTPSYCLPKPNIWSNKS